MQDFTYKGEKKTFQLPLPACPTPLMEDVTFILCGSYPAHGIKSNGSKLFCEFKESQVIDYNLDLFYKICKNPDVIITTGQDHKDFVKHHRKSQFSIVQNCFFEFSNTAEDLRIGLLAARNSKVVFIESGFIPTFATMKLLVDSGYKSSKIYTKDIDDEYPGVKTSGGIVKDFCFNTYEKITGMYYLCEKDISKARKKAVGKDYSRNQFAFEFLKSVNLYAMFDNTESVLVTR